MVRHPDESPNVAFAHEFAYCQPRGLVDQPAHASKPLTSVTMLPCYRGILVVQSARSCETKKTQAWDIRRQVVSAAAADRSRRYAHPAPHPIEWLAAGETCNFEGILAALVLLEGVPGLST